MKLYVILDERIDRRNLGELKFKNKLGDGQTSVNLVVEALWGNRLDVENKIRTQIKNNETADKKDKTDQIEIVLLGFNDPEYAAHLEKIGVKVHVLLGRPDLDPFAELCAFIEAALGPYQIVQTIGSGHSRAEGQDSRTEVTRQPAIDGGQDERSTEISVKLQRRFETMRHASAQSNEPSVVLFHRAEEKDAWAAFKKSVLRGEWKSEAGENGEPSARDGNDVRIFVNAKTGPQSAATGVLIAVPLDSEARSAKVHLDAVFTRAQDAGLRVMSSRTRTDWILEVEAFDPGPAIEAGLTGFEHAPRFPGQVDAVADFALNAFLLGARPVVQWRTHLFAAFADGESMLRHVRDAGETKFKFETVDKNGPDEPDHYTYWLPDVRELLLPDKAKSAGVFQTYVCQTPDIGSIAITGSNYPDDHLRLPISRVRLHFNPGNTFLLEWIVGLEDDLSNSGIKRTGEAGTSPALWRHYLNEENRHSWSLARVVDFNAEARLIKQDYKREVVDRKGTKTITKPQFISHQQSHQGQQAQQSQSQAESKAEPCMAQQILATIFPDLDPPGRLTDSRARVATSLILDGSSPEGSAASEFEALLSRVSAVDTYGTGYAYSEEFARAELNASAYRRFWSWGSHYMLTSHSLSFVGFRHSGDVVQPAPDNTVMRLWGYAERHIHPRHMDGVYDRLFRVFLAIEANLQDIGSRLAKIELELPVNREVLDRSEHDRITELRHELESLTDRLMHMQFSTQIQGQEMTAILHRQFGLDRQWSEIDSRIKLLEEQWQRIARARWATRANGLYLVGTLLAVALGIYGLQSLSPLEQQSAVPGIAEIDPTDWLWSLALKPGEWLGRNPGLPPSWAVPLGFGLFCAFVWGLAIVIIDMVAISRSEGLDFFCEKNRPGREPLPAGWFIGLQRQVRYVLLLAFVAFWGLANFFL